MCEDDVPKIKLCKKCSIERDVREFYWINHKPQSPCKQCRIFASHERYDRVKNTLEHKAKRRQYRQKNKLKIYKGQRTCYEKNRSHYNSKSREWSKNNPHKKQAIGKRYREKLKADPKRYSAFLEYRRKYKQKLSKEPSYRLNRTMGRTISEVLSERKNYRRWEILVGYTLEDLKKHLESQFDEDMTWDNYGIDGWHVDHIIPITAFNYDKPEHIDFKRCWALKNLRPLWAKDNIRKYNKINQHFQPMLRLQASGA